MKRFFLHITLLFITASFVACNNLKHIPQNDTLYTGASIVFDSTTTLPSKKKKALKEELASLTRPYPNKKILGIRFKLSAYNIAGNPKKKNSPAGWLKNKVGEAPVLGSSVNINRNTAILRNTLENKGYFNAQVEGEMISKKKKSTANYSIKPGEQYVVKSYIFEGDSSLLSQEIKAVMPTTLIPVNKPFNLEYIKEERNRIDDELKQKGFYYFDPDFLIVQIDSTIGNNELALYLKVKPVTPTEAKRKYTINDVFIFPGFRLNAPDADTLKKDATLTYGYYVFDRQELYKPHLFKHTMQFQPGDTYNRTDHNTTLSRLINLNLFKFVKNRLEPVHKDSSLLNAYYYLTPHTRQALRGEATGTVKSNNLAGTLLKAGWRKRNAFRGGEILSIDATGGFEVQYSGQLKGYNTYRYGLEGNLTFPRYILPFNVSNKGGFIPKTNINAAFDILTKQKLYSMTSIRTALAYSWKNNIKNEHILTPITLTYVQPSFISQQYRDSIVNNPSLEKSIEKQFIVGSTYNYNYNEVTDNHFASGFYLNTNMDLSGNITGLLTGANAKEGNIKNIFNAPFSQYIRNETELRYYWRTGKNQVWVNRLIAGIGIPYGNSLSLPFIKQFFAGGNNSIRAFRSRAIGPGSYESPIIRDFLPDQSGDIKLEFNTEYRMKLFSIVHGALFVDAGNVWLFNEDIQKLGGKFTNRFMNEIAVGAGAGIRFDLSVLVLRIDVAIPLRKPYLPENDRWVIKNINIGNNQWRKENIILNLGIGYPF